MIDFKNDQESLELHSKEISDRKLLEFVWLRIFEKFKMNLHFSNHIDTYPNKKLGFYWGLL